MAILIDRETRVLVQGITGYEGLFHASQMLEYGTQLVGGVSPGKGGEWVELSLSQQKLHKPLFDTVKVAVEATGATATLISVPAPFAADAIYEAIDAGMRLLVCITVGIPILDLMKIRQYIRHTGSCLIGPNCAGVISPGQAKIGIIPHDTASKGRIGIVSRTDVLMYEVMRILSEYSLGQSTCVDLGGEPVYSTSVVDILERFENDPETEKIVLLGRIDGRDELEAAEYMQRMTKPVVAYIAGQHTPAEYHEALLAPLPRPQVAVPDKINTLKRAWVRVAETLEDIPLLLNMN